MANDLQAVSGGDQGLFYYLAGPYSIDPAGMYDLHLEKASQLLRAGFVVYSPIVECHPWHLKHPEDYDKWVERDLFIVPRLDALIRLPGPSSGSDREQALAEQYGKPIWAGETPVEDVIAGKPPTIAGKKHKPTFDCILDEAKYLTTRDRHDDYGHPYHDFSRIAKIWEVIFGIRVTPRQVALAMMGVKISRLLNSPDHWDSLVDIPGYANCYDMVRRYEEEHPEA